MAYPPSPSRQTLADRIHRLNPGQRAALFGSAGVLGLILPCCGGLTVLGAVIGPQPRPSASADRHPAAWSSSEPATRPPADADSTRSLSLGATASPSPRIEKRQVTEEQEIPFGTTNVNDPNLPQGTTQIRTPGAPGVKTITYEVTFTDGVQTDKKQLSETITKAPVTQVVAIGTRQEPPPQKSTCDPNYSGACVPVASDVDCAGGSGNGPAYVSGPVKVVGRDIYRLDSDGDGWGCE